jgi:hypothetical protein
MNQPMAERLKTHFSNVASDLRTLLQEINVKFVDHRIPGVAVVAPNYYWNQRSPQQENIRIGLKREYERFFEMLNLMLRQAPNDIIYQFNLYDKRFRDFIELSSSWSLSDNMEDNLNLFNATCEDIIGILDIFHQKDNVDTLLIPDTNSLLINCDPVAYRTLVNTDRFTFLLLPTVIGELDKLKYNHRNPDVKDKAEKVIKRIKGWRAQGTLTSGIKVDKTIVVKSLYKEPDMGNTLSWLDSNVQDDRIIANVLSVQAENTSSIVYLVTRDINLQNKADAVFIATMEIA